VSPIRAYPTNGKPQLVKICDREEEGPYPWKNSIEDTLDHPMPCDAHVGLAIPTDVLSVPRLIPPRHFHAIRKLGHTGSNKVIQIERNGTVCHGFVPVKKGD